MDDETNETKGHENGPAGTGQQLQNELVEAIKATIAAKLSAVGYEYVFEEEDPSGSRVCYEREMAEDAREIAGKLREKAVPNPALGTLARALSTIQTEYGKTLDKAHSVRALARKSLQVFSAYWTGDEGPIRGRLLPVAAPATSAELRLLFSDKSASGPAHVALGIWVGAQLRELGFVEQDVLLLITDIVFITEITTLGPVSKGPLLHLAERCLSEMRELEEGKLRD